MYNENTIWQLRQNQPELIIEDCKKFFKFNDKQCEKMREILMYRGVNKWLYARLLFINLKHSLKEKIKLLCRKEINYFETRKIFLKAYAEMQEIAKMSRWVEWPKKVHKNMKNVKNNIKLLGKSC